MNIQTIELNNSQYIILPKAEFDVLLGKHETNADITAAAAVRERINAGEETIPADVINRLILSEENPVKVFRKWRGMTAADLAHRVGISLSYLSDIETGKKDGSLRVMKTIAVAMKVDLDLLV